MKILIDLNIRREAITHQSTSVPKIIEGWGQFDVLQRTKKVADANRSEQITYLATLANMAKTGELEFYNSHELVMERFNQKILDEGSVGFNLFNGIKFNNAKTPVFRDLRISAFGSNFGITRAEQVDFFSFASSASPFNIKKAYRRNSHFRHISSMDC